MYFCVDKMKDIKIEKGVPVPAKKTKGGSAIITAIEKLRVNESFYFDRGTGYFGAYIFRIKLKYPRRQFTSRKEKSGSRIWRIK